MHGAKLLIFVVIIGAIVAAGVFFFFPKYRPAAVEKVFRQASGLTPAKTPTEALDKFREAIKRREYNVAADYCDKDYREQMLKAADGAKKLGDAIDSLLYNMDTKGVVNAKTKQTLRLLEPFPKTFTVVDVKESKDGTKAVARIAEDEKISVENLPRPDVVQRINKIIHAYVPVDVLTTKYDTIELFKDETGHWKIQLPVTPLLRLKVEYLRDNATNYANGITQVRDEVRNNPVTKEQIQTALEERIGQSQ